MKHKAHKYAIICLSQSYLIVDVTLKQVNFVNNAKSLSHIMRSLYPTKLKHYFSRNRELESHIAEKDAMIRVLQRRVEEKDVLYQKALIRTTLGSGKRYLVVYVLETVFYKYSDGLHISLRMQLGK